MTKQAIIVQPSSNLTEAIFQMLQVASASKNPDPKYLSEMLNVWKDRAAIQAKCDFDVAFATVKTLLPTIVKNNEVSFGANGKGSYQYEDLASISKAIDKILSAHGLSYRFHTSSTADTVTVTCRLSHVSGHTEENSLTGPYDRTGSKNPVQALGSTVSYLQRYTLKSALGLAAAKDNDANIEVVSQGKTNTINASQIEDLQKLIEEKNGDLDGLYKHYKVSDLSELLVGQYEDAKIQLNSPKRKIKIQAQGVAA